MDERNSAQEEGVAIYEIGYHVLPTRSEEELLTVVGELKKVLEGAGATELSEGEPELIELAYTMTKLINNKYERFATAYFGWMKFEMTTEKTSDIKQALDENDNLLRYLFVRATKDAPVKPNLLEEVKGDGDQVIETKTEDESQAKEVSEAELDKELEKIV